MTIRQRLWDGSAWGGITPALIPGYYKPDATNTGTSGTLTPYTGEISATTGQTIENLDITGKITVNASNVTVRNCKVRGGTLPTGTQNWGLIDANGVNCLNLIIEDCELVPDSPNVGWTGVLGHDYTVRRTNIYRTVDGCGVYNSNSGMGSAPVNVTIEANYIHDLAYIDPDPNHTSDNHTHNDGIQIQGGTAIDIVGNTIVANCASGITSDSVSPYYPSVTGQAIGITTPVGTTYNCLIDRNWLDYGAQSITVAQQSLSTSATISNNKFGRNQANLYKDGVTARRAILADPDLTMPGLPTSTGQDTAGNVYEDDGTPVTVYRTNTY